MTINQGIIYFKDVEPKIAASLKVANDIALGHLKIGQSTNTLSGGENIRIKLIGLEKTRATTIGIDEPFKGLNPSEIFMIMKFLIKLREKGKTIIVADHTDMVIPQFDKHVSIGIQNNLISEMK